jgi:hypothetical protein
LPVLALFSATHGVAAPTFDLWSIRFSLTIAMIGFFIHWRARRPAVMGLGLRPFFYSRLNMLIPSPAISFRGLGDGLEPALSSFASAMVRNSSSADLFAFTNVIDTVAKLVGGPAIAAAFSIRDDMGKSLGYCFALSAVSCSILFSLSDI